MMRCDADARYADVIAGAMLPFKLCSCYGEVAVASARMMLPGVLIAGRAAVRWCIVRFTNFGHVPAITSCSNPLAGSL